MSKLRMRLADDRAMRRDGLSVPINDQADMEIIARAGPGRQAAQLARECEPDIALPDIQRPAMSGIQAAQQNAPRLPSTRLTAPSRSADPGFALERSAARAPIRAIRVVAAGESYVEPERAGDMFSLPAPPRRATGAAPSGRAIARTRCCVR